MAMKRFVFLFLLVFVFLLGADQSDAQCAMCRATAESASKHNNEGIGEGLNTGIVYLMGVPYLLLALGALVFFRKKIASLFRG